MATTTITVLEDGPRNAVIKLTGDLASGDFETDALKIDISTLCAAPDGSKPTNLSIMGIIFSTTNIEVMLQWEGSGNPMFYVCPAYFSHHVNFRSFGGVINDAPARTGNILLTTKTRTVPSVDAQYVITLWLKKRYN